MVIIIIMPGGGGADIPVGETTAVGEAASEAASAAFCSAANRASCSRNDLCPFLVVFLRPVDVGMAYIMGGGGSEDATIGIVGGGESIVNHSPNGNTTPDKRGRDGQQMKPTSMPSFVVVVLLWGDVNKNNFGRQIVGLGTFVRHDTHTSPRRSFTFFVVVGGPRILQAFSNGSLRLPFVTDGLDSALYI